MMTTKVTDAPEATQETDVALPSESEPTEATAPHASEAGTTDAPGDAKSTERRKVSVSVRGLVVGAVIVALVAAVAVLGWLYYDARHQRDVQVTQLNNNAHAEQIALDYAVKAATMDYKDLQAWHVNLVAGTSPELNKRLSDAGTSMEQVLVPLQWSSVAQPLVAKVRSNTGGVYVVDSFVSVQTKTVQSPEALQSTATYSMTIDSNNNWQITDVGGIGSAMGPK
jgi:type II secretory pathway pseudopilin PulG